MRPDDRYENARDVIAALFGSATLVHRCYTCGARVRDRCRCVACQRRFGDPPYVLAFESGPAGQAFVAAEGSYIVGREVLCPSDRHIARQQLAIGVGKGAWLRDGGAANPTTIDGVVLSGSVQLLEASRVGIARNEGVVRRDWG